MPVESLALLAAACWALASVFSAPASSHMGAFAFTRWRMLFASLILGLIVAFTGGWRSLGLEAIMLLVLSGLIGIFVGDTALFACMNRLGPRRSGILFATHALFSVLLAWAFLGEHIQSLVLVGGALLVTGVMTAIAFGKRDDEGHRWEATRGRLVVGLALGLLAAFGQSVGTLILKPLMSSGVDAMASSAVRMVAGLGAHAMLWLTGWQVARNRAPLNLRDLGFTFASAAVALALGMTLILQALAHGSAGLVGLLSSVSPVLLLPVLWVAYGRRPAAGAWAGALLAVAGCGLILGRG